MLASPDGLYDGQFLTATARWWNQLLEADSDFGKYDFPKFDAERASRLVAVPNEKNRKLFAAVAESLAGSGTLAASALSLAYALAVTFETGGYGLSWDDPSYVAWRMGDEISVENFERFSKHYEIGADDIGLEPMVPYWYFQENMLESALCALAARACRWAFDDQVKRWGKAEGFDLSKSIGAPDYAMISVQDADAPSSGLPTFVDLLFDWGGRLRHFEHWSGPDWDDPDPDED